MGKVSWRKKRQPTPVFLSEKFHRQRSLGDYSPWGHKKLDTKSPDTTSQLVASQPGGSDGKESACNAGDPGSIPRLGRSPGERSGNPLTILFWRIPWTEEPGGLQSIGS